jgi:hypothetical protein
LLEDQGPSKEEVMKAIEEHNARRPPGPRSGWQVKAAVWVKKMHVDRGAVPVARPLPKSGKIVVVDSLRPQYVVPDLKDCKLRPYVAHYDESEATSSAAAPATAQ